METQTQTVIRRKPSTCSGCILECHGSDFSRVEGLGSLGVMVVAESSGDHESREQLPLRPYAPSGAIFERTLRRLGYSREQFAVTNIVRCRPKDNFLDGAPWELNAIRHCQPNLIEALRKYKPKVIIALGNLSFRTLTGISGNKQTISHMRGYVFRALPEFCEAAGVADLLVVPTYHPAFLRRGAIHLTGVLARDIQRAVNIRQGKDRSFILEPPPTAPTGRYDSVSNPDPWDDNYEQAQANLAERMRQWLARYNLRYNVRPSRAELDYFCRDTKAKSDAWLALSPDAQAHSLLALSWDLETYESASLDEDATEGYTDTQIRLFQATTEPGTGLALDWKGEHIRAAHWLMKLPLPKIGHNIKGFDERVQRAVGQRDFGDSTYLTPNGPRYDTLRMFRYWQPDLPAHLQFASTFACLASNTRIRLWNGKSEKINNIVTKKMNVDLLGMDEQGNRIPLKIVNWFRADSPGQRWLKIRVNNTNQAIFCTPEHKIWTLQGWKLASDVQIGDRVVIEKCGHNSLIHGTILGDGSVTEQGRLDLTHCEAQLDYLQAKAKTLPPCKFQRRPNLDKAKDRFNYRIGCSIGTYWKRLFYPEGKKIFIAPPDMAALAIWYCDDGSITHHRNGRCYDPKICVSGFSDDCKDRLYAWFCNLLGTDQVKWTSNDSPQYGLCERASIRFNLQGAWIFWRLIAPFVPPAMYRKLPPDLRGQYNGWLDKQAFQHQEVVSVEDWSPERKDGAKHVRYCVEVDHPTHRYFALGGLVSNSFPFPWKHLAGSNIEVYGIADVDAALRDYIVLRRTMEDRGLWFDDRQPSRQAAGFLAMVTQTESILTDMEDRGLPVDDERRRALDVEFEAAEREALTELDAKFPNAARKVTPKVTGKVTGYAGVPPQVVELLDELSPLPDLGFREQLDAKGKLVWVNAAGEKVTKKLVEIERKAQLQTRALAATSGETLADIALRQQIAQRVFFEPPEIDSEDGKETPGETYRYEVRRVNQVVLDENLGLLSEGDVRWVRVYQFSPNSPAQLQSYMQVKGHKIPTKKTGENTTDKTGLARLASQHKDDFYTKVIDCRELRKMRGTYIDGFKPRPETGCVHTTFTYDTGTMQLSSRNPNVQNAPKHGKLAKAVRSMIREEGKVLVEWDFKSYHVLTTGFCAKSANYMRMARLDMHSFVAGHFNRDWDAFKIFSETNEELAERFSWFKKDPARKFIRDKKAKPSILGIGFGLGEQKLYDMNRESFRNQAEARALRETIRALFPEVFAWQEAIRQQAHRDGFLKNDFGAIRWFYEVYAPDGKGGWKPGEQSEQAIAFLPASLAFGNIREAMKDLERRGLNEKWSLRNTVHDSLVFLIDPARLEDHQHDIYPVLHAPSKVLVDPVLAPEGLVVDVECSVGLDWGSMKEVKLPEGML